MSSTLKLFCLPYAGGSATLFSRWASFLPEEVEIHVFDYSRNKSRESPYQNLKEIVDELVDQVVQTPEPFLFFGHSMGAVLSYFAGLKLQVLGRPPECVVFSGFPPPRIYFRKERKTYALPDDQFIAALESLEAIPQAFKAQPKALRLFLPDLKQIFYLLESFKEPFDPDSLNCPLYVATGDRDPMTQELDKEEWNHMTSYLCQVDQFEGNHFFVDEPSNRFRQYIKEITESILRPAFKSKLN